MFACLYYVTMLITPSEEYERPALLAEIEVVTHFRGCRLSRRRTKRCGTFARKGSEFMSDRISAQVEILKAAVGTEKTVRLGQICHQDLSRFETAAGIDASSGGERPDVAPHLYLTSVMGWRSGPPETDLAPTGPVRPRVRGFPLTGLRLMGAGQDLEFHVRNAHSMVITETTRLDDVHLKQEARASS